MDGTSRHGLDVEGHAAQEVSEAAGRAAAVAAAAIHSLPYIFLQSKVHSPPSAVRRLRGRRPAAGG